MAAADAAERVLRRLPASSPLSSLARVPALELLIRARARLGDFEAAASPVAELERAGSELGTPYLLGRDFSPPGSSPPSVPTYEQARRSYEDAIDRFEEAQPRTTSPRRGSGLPGCSPHWAGRRRRPSRRAPRRARSRRWGPRRHPRPSGYRPARTLFADLTPRELEVLQFVAQGLGDGEIAERLVLSPHTVHRHVANVRTKLRLPRAPLQSPTRREPACSDRALAGSGHVGDGRSGRSRPRPAYVPPPSRPARGGTMTQSINESARGCCRGDRGTGGARVRFDDRTVRPRRDLPWRPPGALPSAPTRTGPRRAPSSPSGPARTSATCAMARAAGRHRTPFGGRRRRADAAQRRYALPAGHAEVLVDRRQPVLHRPARPPSARDAAPAARSSWKRFEPARACPTRTTATTRARASPTSTGRCSSTCSAAAGCRRSPTSTGGCWPARGRRHRLRHWLVEHRDGAGLPEAPVDGFDADEASIEAARANAAGAGVGDRVRFHVRDAGDPALDGSRPRDDLRGAPRHGASGRGAANARRGSPRAAP